MDKLRAKISSGHSRGLFRQHPRNSQISRLFPPTVQYTSASSVSVPVLMLSGVLALGSAPVSAQTVIVPRVPVAAAPKTNPTATLPSGNPNSTNSNVAGHDGSGTAIYSPTVLSGTFSPYQVNQSTNTATITETSNAGILSWNSFNIGSGSTVNFVQPSSSSVLLNRVTGSVSASMLNGVLNANGIVYLYNPSGIVFGKNAVVNVNSLIASTLNIDDNRFLEGILAPSLSPIFQADSTLGYAPGNILVDGDSTSQAKLTAADGGKIMLFAPNVTNNGVVTAPDGQVIMAAGGKVYLSAPTDTSMRGLFVEVDSSNLSGASTSVTNNGTINVGRGNASLVGLAVNQNGTITAQTSVTLNGSIYLMATGGAQKTGSTTPAIASTTGNLTLGSGSVTKISILDDGSTVTQGPQDTPFNASQVQLVGKNINVDSGAQIIAHGGKVSINATAMSDAAGPDGSTVNLAPGSLIDVSGDTTTMPMSSNVISVQLLAELADNVLLRDSSIRGDTLNFDIRTGTNIADISADLAKIPFTVGQLAAVGGTVSINSGGTLVQQANSSINVSGGQINYTAGYVNTSKLISGGALFSDSNAPLNRTYSGFVNLPNGRWDYQPAYFDGKNAGTVDLVSPDIVLQGSMVASTVNGQYQRNVDATNRATGGELVIGNNPGANAAFTTGYGNSNQIYLDNSGTVPASTDVATALASNRLDLNVEALNANGFTQLALYTSNTIDVTGNLNVNPGGSINLTSLGKINFSGGVTMPGGTVSAKSGDTVTVDSNVNFNLAGTWTNDTAGANPTLDSNGNPTGAIVLKGGNLTLSGAQVLLEPDVTIDVSGGAWMSNKRKLTYGAGGNVTLSANPNAVNPDALDSLVKIGAGLDLESYSFTEGGTLTLQTNAIQIGGSPPNVSDASVQASDMAKPKSSNQSDPTGEYLWIPGNFFSTGGFSTFSLNGISSLAVMPGTDITAVAQNWMFKSVDQWRDARSGSISTVATPVTLNLVGPDSGRQPVNISLSSVNSQSSTVTGDLTFGLDSTLTTDPKATVSLTAGNLLDFDGTIDAPGGTINLGLSQIDPAGIAYDPTRSIWIGADAHLFATGTTAMLYTNANGITTGQVLGGGTINIGGAFGGNSDLSDVGYITVAQQSAFGASGGATFDVSGVASGPAVLLSGRNRTSLDSIASAGGTVEVFGREGIFFGGTAKGQAGNSTQQGGTFSITLEQGQEAVSGYPDTDPATLTIAQGATTNTIPASWVAGHSFAGFEDQALIGTGSFANGGFDNLYFKSQDAIVLSSATGSFDLSAKSTIYLDAPVLQASTASGASTPLTSVQINSSYVQLGSDDYLYQNNPTSNVLTNPNNNYFSTNSVYQNNVATGGAATLTVNATTIDLAGTTVVDGVSNTNLNATQDIRLVGVSQTNLANAPSGAVVPTLQELMPTGEFSVVGNLTLTSAQVYPVTLSSFALNAEGSNSNLNFVSNGSKPYAPLSAAGTLFGFAQNINQSGVVVAPFGTIDLVAGKQLTYVTGSTTSVAGTGTVPLGMIINGREWVYDFGQGNEVEFDVTTDSTSNLPETSLPSKVIISQAPNVTTQAGATLDLSGGGKLYGYEFTAGSFGTADVLTNNVAGSQTNVFAILPGYADAVAPRDYQYGQNGGLQEGETVYLSGIAGLPAGNYVLLPAHYALLPGAMAVTLTSSGLDLVAADNVVNLDGTMTLAGRTNVLGAGSPRTNAITVTPGSVVREESQYQEYDATTFFTAAAKAAGVTIPELPTDGGHLEFDATNTLALAGQIQLNAGKDGRNGIVDISAPVIDVVADASQTGAAGALTLVASDLNNLSADSLLLGGIRQFSNGVTDVYVGAQSVNIENNSANPLTGSEIILAAQNNVTLAPGAVVQASGTVQRAPTTLVIEPTTIDGTTVGTDGALLRVSAGAEVGVQRNAPAGNTGVLTIGQGAVVGATGSAYLDGTSNTINDGQLALASGAALGLAAPRISIGDAIPTSGITGLQINDASLNTLNALTSLTLSSYTTIDLYGTVNLGSSSMSSLVLDSSGFQGNYSAGRSGNVNLTAQNVTLGGGGTFVTAGAVNAGSAGSFNVTAQNIDIGNGKIAVNGYANTNLNATGKVDLIGSGTITAAQNLTVTADAINAAPGATMTVAAGNNLNLVQAGAAPAVASGTMGGSAQFTANRITSDADISLPSGSVTMTAANGVAITGGTIYAGGGAEVFGTTTAYAPAGSISLNGGNGNVVVGSAAVLDVSAIGAAAGQLNVSATGTNSSVALNGTLKGAATAVGSTAQTQGSFSIDTANWTSPSQLDVLAAALSKDGFTQAQDFRIRQGDADLASGATITAQNVNISTDNGSINIAGKINASGAAGGAIGLYASQTTMGGGTGNVNLLNGSVLNASANTLANSSTDGTAGSTGTGGAVTISTASADGQMAGSLTGGSTISFASGAVINVAGKSNETDSTAYDGSVLFRAPQLVGGNDVAISALQGSVAGSNLTAVEGYKVYYASKISSAADQSNGDGTYANLQAATTTGAVPTNGVMYIDAQNFANGDAAAALAARSNPNLLLTVMPGIEVRSDGNLTVSVNETSSLRQDRGWNLDGWHFNGAPTDLTLRAAGDLLIDGSISDGFIAPATSARSGLAMPDWTLDSTISGNFKFAGGADLSAANPLSVIASSTSGDVQINFANTNTNTATDTPVALVRTGTGSIDIAAGGDVVLGTLTYADSNLTQSATIYTAGMAVPAYSGVLGEFTAPLNQVNTQYGAAARTTAAAQFAEDGGAISIMADHNVIGAPQDQLVNNWLFHQGQSTTNADGVVTFTAVAGVLANTAWWADPGYFDQGIATMAGGGITINAGGYLQDVSASVASNAFMPGTSPTVLVQRGGGNLTVQAGGSIYGGSFYVQTGQADINSGGSITAGTLQSNGSAVNPIFALGDAQLTVTARDDLNIEGIYNPTLAAQSIGNIGSLTKHPQLGIFTTYTDASSVDMTSVAGNVVMTNNESGNNLIMSNMGAESIPIATLDGDFAAGTTGFDQLYTYTPPTLTIAALNGSFTSTSGFTVAGAPKGQLNILAANSVTVQGSPIVMLDVAADAISPYFAPVVPDLTSTGYGGLFAGSPVVTGLFAHTAGGLHTGDDQPDRIIALNGDITGDMNLQSSIILPKFAEISAGNNITNLGFTIQQNAASDVTTVSAGNNFSDATVVSGIGSSIVQNVDGPGRIDFIAGHNFDLGDSNGIVTRGNLENPYMSAGSAAIDIQAGTTTADYVDFMKNFVTLSELSSADQSALVAFVNANSATQVSSPTAAWTAFQNLSRTAQASFASSIQPDLNAIFFAGLVTSSSIKGLTKFDSAIATLFPNINSAGGDINVFASQLKTEQGGSIYLFSPGGSTYAGLPNMPGYLKKDASDEGIFSIAGGAIGALVNTNFEVDQGRVFTLGGGDITLVSQYGDLSAGAGTKTASSAPPPILTTDPNGNTVVDISGSISGSGIATLQAYPDVPPASVYVIAPRGVFDAGDAGVRSSGSVEVNALVVLNGGNIVAAGAVTGVPTIESVNVGAGLSSSATPNVGDVAKGLANGAAANNASATNLSVDVLGYGGDSDSNSNAADNNASASSNSNGKGSAGGDGDSNNSGSAKKQKKN